MAKIYFFNEDIRFTLLQKRRIRQWIESAINEEGKEAGEINFIFCSDDMLYEMNVRYLEHDTYTDIITFDMSDKGSVSGDVFISVERAKENARKYGEKFQEEIKRLIIHGVLHLLGQKDKALKDREIMTNKENKYLNKF